MMPNVAAITVGYRNNRNDAHRGSSSHPFSESISVLVVRACHQHTAGGAWLLVHVEGEGVIYQQGTEQSSGQKLCFPRG